MPAATDGIAYGRRSTDARIESQTRNHLAAGTEAGRKYQGSFPPEINFYRLL